MNKYMQRDYLRHTWINPKLISGKSIIHGEGVFSKGKIVLGEKIMEFGGKLISRQQAFSDNYRIRSVWPIDQDRYLALPNSDTQESLDENLNHSCDANAWLADEVTLVAKKDINSGEEITMDQGTWNFENDSYTDNKKPCSCGAINCRHVLTKDDWKIPSVRENYKGHFHPMIQKIIDRE